MMPIVGVGAIVFDDRGRVLLVERGRPPGQGLWSIPGGKLEPRETLAQAVAREVREETGLIVEVGTLACVLERFGDDYHFVLLDYFARITGGALAAASDARAAQFVDFDQLAALPLTEGLADVLVRARATQPPWSTSRSRHP
ncbi:MAG: NUDIX domain-containing protein [Deltaproteobacteria bacterium]|nr:MAG: NUDIX domain-containing protein [Deltaproteobacteria bacterium]TMQ15780.1 MAG: NUDIX domain-containing protein [Deltaproteobacteria bacterium]